MLETDAARDTRIARSVRPLRPLVVALVMAALLVSPVSAGDRDGDGLRDGFESRYGATSPDSRDTDGDGVIDSAEDNDRDKLGNLGEQRFGTNPRKRDSDGDGRPDGLEDKDRDGRSNAREQDQRPVPAGLTPSLAKAPDNDTVHKTRCDVRPGSTGLKRCVFGKRTSGTKVALVGDSKARMFLPAFISAARQEGWKLVTLLKRACLPLLDTKNASQFLLDDGRSCRAWRQAALAWLRKHPPDVIVLAHSDDYRLIGPNDRPLSGSRRLSAWRDGMTRTLTALPRSSTVMLLGDVPDMPGDPVNCLRRNTRNMSACTVAREPQAQRRTEMALRQAAKAADARFRTLYGKICTYDPCPLVHGDVLMWRDGKHLTTTFTKRLTPSVRGLVGTIISARRSEARREEAGRAARLAVTEGSVDELPDADGDGLRDRFEQRWGVSSDGSADSDGDGLIDAAEDPDGDRLSNLGEQRFGSDPRDQDSDDDGTPDGEEDADGDGESNAREQDRRPVPSGLSPTTEDAWWDRPSNYDDRCHNEAADPELHPCTFGDTRSDVTVALLGDSHALQWLPALDAAGSRAGWEVVALTKAACPPAQVEFGRKDPAAGPSCTSWRAAVLASLADDPPDVALLTGAGRGYNLVDAQGERIAEEERMDHWQRGLEATLESLPDSTMAIVLADTPKMARNPVSCLDENPTDMAACVTPRSAAVGSALDQAERAAAASTGAAFESLNDVVCPYGPCPVVIGDTLMWRNRDHLTATFVEQLTPSMQQLIGRHLGGETTPGRQPLEEETPA